MKDEWRERLIRLGYAAEGRFDRIKYRAAERFQPDRVSYVQPYRWYAGAKMIQVRGRVLQNNGLATAEADDNIWDNILNTYRRFNSDELPHAEVTVRFGEQEIVVEADEEGYFTAQLATEKPLAAGWHSAEVSLADSEPVDAPFLVVSDVADSAEFGIISDIDDTILKTNATNLLRAAQLTILGNAHTRLAFAGVAAFYRALSHDGRNPIFYVSSSPWNLYDLLDDFIIAQEIPTGPLCLRDLGIDRNKFITTAHGQHKLAQIEAILTTYPDLPFILIGDSGQKDPEIYSEIVSRFPNRVLAIYIRDV
ncbi:MAG TPA: DUF2183 domain-containing protein, partial [Anaerolineae bacterium]|nr:DUF2183 domain-containing protein [Anaerolineae bacterium]